MKLILSRKGFDSSAGGVPSPIFPDGRMLSLPIPSTQDPLSYNDINWSGGSLGDLVAGLTGRPAYRRLRAHLDPDLDPHARPRLPAWRPAFGQVGAAARHLDNQAVGEKALFLFLGWYREVEAAGSTGWRYRRGAADLHMLFGYLQVGEVLAVGGNPAKVRCERSELAEHPHTNGSWHASNRIYIATDELEIAGRRFGMPGGGLFERYHEGLRLTVPGATRGVWRLPSWFLPPAGPTLTYHTDAARWTRAGNSCVVRTVGRGQEFVIDVPDEEVVAAWVEGLLNPDQNTVTSLPCGVPEPV